MSHVIPAHSRTLLGVSTGDPEGARCWAGGERGGGSSGVGVVGTREVQGEYREGARRAGGISDT